VTWQDDTPLPAELAELIAEKFTALGEPTRIRLLDALRRRGEASVRELADELEAGQANISKHLGVLRERRIVGRRKAGTRVCYRITDENVLSLCELVCGRIEAELRDLASLVEDQPPTQRG
jgi:DNA-binding transcriptional ArsR family regulator